MEALLVDADGRMKEPVNRMLAANQLDGGMRFAHGAIAQGKGETSFVPRSHMASSLAPAGDARRASRHARPGAR